MEAEKIILTKQFYELTPAELEVVSTLVSSEIEFDDMSFAWNAVEIFHAT